MNKVLQLGLQSSVVQAAKFLVVVPFRSLRFGSSIVSVRVGTSSFNKRLMSNATSKSVPLSINNSKGKPMKRSDNDIEAMTVQELRATLRKLGLPVKGLKKELISTLKLHMDNSSQDESSGAEKMETTSSTLSESVTIKRKTRNQEEADDDYYGNDNGEKKVKQSTEKNLKVKVSSKEEEASLTIVVSSSNQSEPWTVLAHKKPEKDWKAYNPKTMRPPSLPEGTKSVKIMTWNVNGLRALLKLESFSALQLAQREDFDVLCLQETKIQVKDVEEIKKALIEGYDHSYWSCSVSKLGYSGTAIISRIKPLSVRYGTGLSGSDHDTEGRIVTAEFESFYLINTYVPNSGDGLKRLSYRVEEWDRTLSNYIKELEKTKPVVLTGDLN
ncbi:hypothetical protein BRARA_D02529, partial [Brassica rapa]